MGGDPSPSKERRISRGSRQTSTRVDTGSVNIPPPPAPPAAAARRPRQIVSVSPSGHRSSKPSAATVGDASLRTRSSVNCDRIGFVAAESRGRTDRRVEPGRRHCHHRSVGGWISWRRQNCSRSSPPSARFDTNVCHSLTLRRFVPACLSASSHLLADQPDESGDRPVGALHRTLTPVRLGQAELGQVEELANTHGLSRRYGHGVASGHSQVQVDRALTTSYR